MAKLELLDETYEERIKRLRALKLELIQARDIKSELHTKYLHAVGNSRRTLKDKYFIYPALDLLDTLHGLIMELYGETCLDIETAEKEKNGKIYTQNKV